MVGWHHQFNGHEFEQAPVDGEGQGIMGCCSPRDLRELGMTYRLNNKDLLKHYYDIYTLNNSKGNMRNILVA